MPILYLTNEELAERIKSREKAPDVPLDAFKVQRRYRLKSIPGEGRWLTRPLGKRGVTQRDCLLLLAKVAIMSIKQAVRLMQLCDDRRHRALSAGAISALARSQGRKASARP